MLLPSKLADTPLDLHDRAYIDPFQIDFVAFTCGVNVFVLHEVGSVVEIDCPIAVDGGIDGRCTAAISTAENIDREAAAVIQGYSHSVRVDVEGDDDADEADPSDRVVEVKVRALAYCQISRQ